MYPTPYSSNPLSQGPNVLLTVGGILAATMVVYALAHWKANKHWRNRFNISLDGDTILIEFRVPPTGDVPEKYVALANLPTVEGETTDEQMKRAWKWIGDLPNRP